MCLFPVIYTCFTHVIAIWHPHYVADIKNIKLDGMQCRANKIIPELRDKPYQERL